MLEAYADNPNGEARWLSVPQAHHWSARARRLARPARKAGRTKFANLLAAPAISDWRPEGAAADE